ncbi:hypothetical protein L596_027082 [Steinernema carpocapsae]|uniref:Uncharacterized protein n=1 Tax=Steinernema carpocapsae TaxID=34508 RepID=A0A4U5M3A0_STECR|nr:hypothetical protein L596_027082 [Steinernema carpocapsae]
MLQSGNEEEDGGALMTGVTVVQAPRSHSNSGSSTVSSGFAEDCRLPSTSTSSAASTCSSCSSSARLCDEETFQPVEYELRRLSPLDFLAVKRICSEAYRVPGQLVRRCGRRQAS